MLKKMRWHFIGAAMIAFSSVILILLCIINVLNAHHIIQQQDDTLKALLYNQASENPSADFSDNTTSEQNNINAKMPHHPGPSQFSPEIQYMMRFFFATYDHTGDDTDIVWNINKKQIASITEDEAKIYADTIFATGRLHGFYKGYRYLVSTTDTETTIIFLNSERELQMIRSLFILTASIAIVCLCIVFILVTLFSKKAIAPYIKNIETQKQFITNASHELKTPLTAIATSADVLAITYENDEWIDNIQAQSARLSKLIQNLVTLSRLDEANPFPEKTEFSLSDIAWEVTEPFAALADAHGKSYTQSIEDHILMHGDAAAMSQTISILLDNALKYSDEHGQIHFALYRQKKKIKLEISNTFTPSDDNHPDISRLFDRFYKGDLARSGQICGSGIGLSIAKATVLAHGGSICAKQPPDSIVISATFY